MKQAPFVCLLLLIVSAVLMASTLLAPPLLAEPVGDPIVATWPAMIDPGDDDAPVDPANLDYTPTLGDPMLPGDEDQALANIARSPGDDTLIYPLGLMPGGQAGLAGAQSSTNVHYLSYSYKGAPVVLVGVSADNACHFIGPGAAQCSYGTGSRYGADFKPFIDDLVAQGLNSLRLWVSIVGGNTTSTPVPTTCPGAPPVMATPPGTTRVTNDYPFKYAGGSLVNGVGRWWLDTRDSDYFQRLADVVAYASAKSVLVEVTLFSPLTGSIGVGPYGKDHAYLSNGTKLPGFTDTANFTNIASAEYPPMSAYLLNVIHWTVDALYSYPNIYFEVANEPESIKFSSPNAVGCGNRTATTPATVAAWQNQIASLLTTYERNTYVTPHGPLAHAHLVAVEPSTKTAAATFVSGGAYAAAGQIINSHYTMFNPQVGQPGDGLGAITMIRMHNSQPKVFGFNETKITGGACGGGNTGSSVEAGRAEAWEFMLGQGGIYNQYGYDCSGAHNCTAAQNSTDDYCRTRVQMGVLRRFLVDPLVNVVYGTRTSTPVDSGTLWINVGRYPLPADFSTAKFWGALEPVSNATNKRWLLYVHHSQRRNFVQGGYLAGIGVPPSINPYQETNLSVCLLGAPAGTYKVRWYTQPDIAVASTPSRSDTIVWSAPAGCTPGGPGAVPLQSSAFYNYDIALLISK